MENPSVVYFTKDITKENLVKIYELLGRKLEGKVGVKIHSGEHDKGHIISPDFMKPLVDLVDGTVIECNSAYPGKRLKSEDHWKLIEAHGFKQFKFDLLDENGDMELPVGDKYKQIKVNFVGKNLSKYDSLIILSHFKGHLMGGFGGAMKNTSIGIGSSKGKAYIHGHGDTARLWNGEQDKFLEAMADACKSVMTYRKDRMVFINVMKDLSIDCDCSSNPHDPEIKDIGILASLDPVALDKACVDLIYQCPEPGKEGLIKRIEEKHGIHTLEAGEEIGIGTTKYTLSEF